MYQKRYIKNYTGGLILELLKLIEEIEDLVEESSGIPFGNKVFVDKKQFLEIIKEIRLQLPDEIKQAEWINTERQRILAEGSTRSRCYSWKY